MILPAHKESSTFLFNKDDALITLADAERKPLRKKSPTLATNLAVKKGHLEILDKLKVKGADFEMKTPFRSSPLY